MEPSGDSVRSSDPLGVNRPCLTSGSASRRSPFLRWVRSVTWISFGLVPLRSLQMPPASRFSSPPAFRLAECGGLDPHRGGGRAGLSGAVFDQRRRVGWDFDGYGAAGPLWGRPTTHRPGASTFPELFVEGVAKAAVEADDSKLHAGQLELTTGERSGGPWSDLKSAVSAGERLTGRSLLRLRGFERFGSLGWNLRERDDL